MLNEYTQEFVISVMKPSSSNRPSSDKIYQGTVIIPYIKGISEKFRRIGNRFNVRTIFKTKPALRGTVMNTGPVEMPSRRSSVCVCCVIVAVVRSAKQIMEGRGAGAGFSGQPLTHTYIHKVSKKVKLSL
jgi:hypothetical protein